jgi:hypothetical protein
MTQNLALPQDHEIFVRFDIKGLCRFVQDVAADFSCNVMNVDRNGDDAWCMAIIIESSSNTTQARNSQEKGAPS